MPHRYPKYKSKSYISTYIKATQYKVLLAYYYFQSYRHYYNNQDTFYFPEYTMLISCADGLIWVSQGLQRNECYKPNMVCYRVTKSTSESMFEAKLLQILIFLCLDVLSVVLAQGGALGLARGLVS